MYEGDTPNAERRAAALSLDRDLLRELLGQEELRDLIDPGALEQVEDDLQCRSEMRQATGRDGLHDVLRGVGDLTVAEARLRVVDGAGRRKDVRGAARERRAIDPVAGEERWIDAADAGLYRDALGAAPPGGLPAAFLEDVPDALARLVRRYAATHGPFTADDVRARYGVDAGAVLSALERGGDLIRGELRPGGPSASGATPRYCDGCAAPRSRCSARRSSPSTPRCSPASCPGGRESTAPATGAGVDRLREVLVSLQGLAVPADVWERDVLPRRAGAYSPAWIDQLCASGELVWIGAGALGRSSGRVALYFREDLPVLGPPPQKGAVPSDSPAHRRCGRGWRGRVLLYRPAGRRRPRPRGDPGGPVGPRLGGRGDQRRLRAVARPRLTLARAQRERGRGRPGPGGSPRAGAAPAPRHRCRAAGR